MHDREIKEYYTPVLLLQVYESIGPKALSSTFDAVRLHALEVLAAVESVCGMSNEGGKPLAEPVSEKGM